jgi:hypothetical protein
MDIEIRPRRRTRKYEDEEDEEGEEGEERYQDQDKREETASVGARMWESRQGPEQDTIMMNGWIKDIWSMGLWIGETRWVEGKMTARPTLLTAYTFYDLCDRHELG